MALAATGAFVLALIKPQFEVGRGMIGKGGVVRDTSLHDAVVKDIESWFINEMKWQHLGTVRSPIDGPAGNRGVYACRTQNLIVPTLRNIKPAMGLMPH